MLQCALVGPGVMQGESFWGGFQFSPFFGFHYSDADRVQLTKTATPGTELLLDYNCTSTCSCGSWRPGKDRVPTWHAPPPPFPCMPPREIRPLQASHHMKTTRSSWCPRLSVCCSSRMRATRRAFSSSRSSRSSLSHDQHPSGSLLPTAKHAAMAARAASPCWMALPRLDRCSRKGTVYVQGWPSSLSTSRRVWIAACRHSRHSQLHDSKQACSQGML